MKNIFVVCSNVQSIFQKHKRWAKVATYDTPQNGARIWVCMLQTNTLWKTSHLMFTLHTQMNITCLQEEPALISEPYSEPSEFACIAGASKQFPALHVNTPGITFTLIYTVNVVWSAPVILVKCLYDVAIQNLIFEASCLTCVAIHHNVIQPHKSQPFSNSTNWTSWVWHLLTLNSSATLNLITACDIIWYLTKHSTLEGMLLSQAAWRLKLLSEYILSLTVHTMYPSQNQHCPSMFCNYISMWVFFHSILGWDENF